ncbi:MAG: 16S rRNA (cytosine(1402)-N(4))-methyltransferase RsmH [Spirochaetes bacterium]|nr:16S rRNA (cytosine(1402)-N(4))-methyltransferase RsmH [Spirochaetota bacterium]
MRHNAGSQDTIVHQPVMYREVLDFAKDVIGLGKNIFVDCTLGEGGHTELLLEVYKDLTIIGFERDSEILKIAEKRLTQYKERINLINDNFRNMANHLSGAAGNIAGMLFDFGISSYHFDKSGRGFSFSRDEQLDMRLDDKNDLNAFYVINKYPEKQLADIFFEYGEERWAKKIAKVICGRRKDKAIEKTGELADIVTYAIPKKYRVKNIHPATRVFQAVRIEVNDELTAISRSIDDAYKYLAKGGVLIAISFHSLEDRIVKDKFRRLSRGCTCELERKFCTCESEPIVSVLTKKPLVAERDEVLSNNRSRSAKLRACIKL